MAVEAGQHKNKSIRAQRFEDTGENPSTIAGVLVLHLNESWNGNPFGGYAKPTASSLKTAFGSADVPMDSLDKLNAIAARYNEIGGPEGCIKDRICGVPPWVCCLPGICCLGGGCLVLTRGNSHKANMRREINALLAEPHEGYKWTLCNASHTAKVNMSNVKRDGPGQMPPNTVTTTIEWLEVVSTAPLPVVMGEAISSAPHVAAAMQRS